MFYVIKTTYVGPNQDQHINADEIGILDEPARTNSSNEARIEGWCGTTNDWSVYAYGEYATLDEADKAIADIFGDVREVESEGPAIKTYKPGKYPRMTRSEVGDWAYKALGDITADTTDERIDELETECEQLANGEGATLGGELGELMREQRQRLRDDQPDDDADE